MRDKFSFALNSAHMEHHSLRPHSCSPPRRIFKSTRCSVSVLQGVVVCIVEHVPVELIKLKTRTRANESQKRFSWIWSEEISVFFEVLCLMWKNELELMGAVTTYYFPFGVLHWCWTMLCRSCTSVLKLSTCPNDTKYLSSFAVVSGVPPLTNFKG